MKQKLIECTVAIVMTAIAFIAGWEDYEQN